MPHGVCSRVARSEAVTLDPRKGARAEVAGPAETLGSDASDASDGCVEQEPATEEGVRVDELLGADALPAGDEMAVAEEL